MSRFHHNSHLPSTKNAKCIWIQKDWMEGPHDLAERWVLAKYLNLLDNHQVVKVKKPHVAKLIHERKHAEHYFCFKYREVPGTANALCYIELYKIIQNFWYMPVENNSLCASILWCQGNSNTAKPEKADKQHQRELNIQHSPLSAAPQIHHLIHNPQITPCNFAHRLWDIW